MKRTILLFALISLPLAAAAAGSAWVRVTNAGSEPVVVDGKTLRRGASATVRVEAGEPGEIFGVSYPALRLGATHPVRVPAPSSSARPAPKAVSPPPPAPVSKPATPASKPICTTAKNAGEAIVAAVETELDVVEVSDRTAHVAKFVYDHVLKDVPPAQRARAMAFADTVNPKKYWMPRSVKTWFGSFDRVVDAWDKVDAISDATGNVLVLGKIGTAVVRGGLDGKSPEQIVADLADSGIETANVWGELAYWSAAIGTGVSNGRSILDSIVDAYDEKHAGLWTKTGEIIGSAAAKTHIALRSLLDGGDRKKFDEFLLEKIREAGYGKEAEEAFLAWVSLDLEDRVRTPFVLKDEWRKKEEPPETEPEHPCFSCWAGDLYGKCSDPKCPNYGNAHSKYKGGGMPSFGR